MIYSFSRFAYKYFSIGKNYVRKNNIVNKLDLILFDVKLGLSNNFFKKIFFNESIEINSFSNGELIFDSCVFTCSFFSKINQNQKKIVFNNCIFLDDLVISNIELSELILKNSFVLGKFEISNSSVNNVSILKVIISDKIHVSTNTFANFSLDNLSFYDLYNDSTLLYRKKIEIFHNDVTNKFEIKRINKSSNIDLISNKFSIFNFDIYNDSKSKIRIMNVEIDDNATFTYSSIDIKTKVIFRNVRFLNDFVVNNCKLESKHIFDVENSFMFSNVEIFGNVINYDFVKGINSIYKRYIEKKITDNIFKEFIEYIDGLFEIGSSRINYSFLHNFIFLYRKYISKIKMRYYFQNKFYVKWFKECVTYYVRSFSNYETSVSKIVFSNIGIIILFGLYFVICDFFTYKNFDIVRIIYYTGKAFTVVGIENCPLYGIAQLVEAFLAIFMNSYLVTVFTSKQFKKIN